MNGYAGNASTYTTWIITHENLGAGVAYVATHPLVGTFAINI